MAASLLPCAAALLQVKEIRRAMSHTRASAKGLRSRPTPGGGMQDTTTLNAKPVEAVPVAPGAILWGAVTHPHTSKLQELTAGSAKQRRQLCLHNIRQSILPC